MLLGAGIADEEMRKYRNTVRRQAVLCIEALIDAVNADPYRFSRAIKHGKATPLILSEASGFRADLIIIGKRGKSALEEIFLGSVTRNILSASECDVLIVHEERRERMRSLH